MTALATLEAALAGRPVDRPLRAPLFAALAAEVEELDPSTFLADAGRRARIYADLAHRGNALRSGPSYGCVEARMSISAITASPIWAVVTRVQPSDLTSLVRRPFARAAAIARSIRSAALPRSKE